MQKGNKGTATQMASHAQKILFETDGINSGHSAGFVNSTTKHFAHNKDYMGFETDNR